MDYSSQTTQYGRPVTTAEAARANEYFEQFLNATSLKQILGYYRGLIDELHLKPNVISLFYTKLRSHLTSWRAKALWKKFDARASHKCYQKGKAAASARVLIIGGGPCGLRTAVEAQLLGAKVVVVEKRDRFSRNNVLHLWPFVIEDLRMLGAKKFFGKFCAGAIDHISIRQLQCILLKVALLLGVEVHTEIGFEKLIEPSAIEKTGWRAEFKPANHPVSHYEFDVIIGADGKRNTLQGFTRKEFRGKLAIAITANFINKRTEAEARVEEISGVAFIFNQKFFKDLFAETGIDLENIVYYKDDTHYFVMTAKKASLLEKGVIKQDLTDTEKLLAPDNVNRDALEQYAIEAANFSTNCQMPDMEFAVNHYGQPDIAMFDFTSMYAADNASKVLERNGHRLLMILVGDSLLEPFWPTGSGCARGFLSALDAAWAVRSWSVGTATPLDVIAERESIYRLLAQTTPDNLNKDWKSYTLDPATRYPNLNKAVVLPLQVVGLYDSDNAAAVERMKKASNDKPNEVVKKRKRGSVDNEVLLSWLTEQLKGDSNIKVEDINSVFKDGKVLCSLIHHYRPDLLDISSMVNEEPIKNNQLAMDILEKEMGVLPIMSAADITNTDDYLAIAGYLTEIYYTFRGEIPHVKQPKLELPESTKISELSFKTIRTATMQQLGSAPPRPSSRHKRHAEMVLPKPVTLDKKTRKRRTLERVGPSGEERQKILDDITSNRAERQNRRRQQRKFQTEQFLKSMQMLEANAKADAQPFEDYSIFLYRQTAPKFEDRVKDLEKQFTYIPDHENKSSSQTFRGGGADEDVAAIVKSLENKSQDPHPIEKKPKDLNRAIGKIERTDWYIMEIEKKMQENKAGKPSKPVDKERVPKWSKEQFLARQTKMEKQHLDRQDSAEAKFADVDRVIKILDQKLKEGTVRELGKNKVATITEKLTSKVPIEPKPVEKKTTRPVPVLPVQGNSDSCHVCGDRVYVVERITVENKIFHHRCFKCHYCNSQLRLGSCIYDRDGLYGNKLFCVQHFGMIAEAPPPVKVTRKPSTRIPKEKTPEKRPYPGIAGVDLLDKVITPERIEFENLSAGQTISDHDDSCQMDEDEWTDKNFGASCPELDETDDDSSSMSSCDSDSDDEDAYDDALEEPVTREGTMKWAERWKNSYSRKKPSVDCKGYSSSDQSYCENSSDDDESDTEGEEEIRARELRKKEVCVEPPIVHTDTGTDTEVKSSFKSNSDYPDIISHHNLLQINDKHSNRSCDNVSADSAEYNSAESGELDLNMNKISSNIHNDSVVVGKLTIANTEEKNCDENATSSNPSPVKPPRNFVLPKKNKKSVGAEFISKFKSVEPEPLLVIKRTPSKISLPVEVGKPKVAVNTNVLNKTKYFGISDKVPKKPLKRSESTASSAKSSLIKQHSLPETVDEKKEIKTFNFEPEDADLNDIDNYIEDLIANEDELLKPIDPEKYKMLPETSPESEDEKISSSIEDLLKELKNEAKHKTDEIKDEKIEDLLLWMDGLDHDTQDRKVCRSFSDVKYKNLERFLKTPHISDSIVSKIPKNNLSFFESHLSGKSTARGNSSESDEQNVPNNKSFNLKRSKTEITFKKRDTVRKSVDLDAVSGVDIRKVLKKFETAPEENAVKEKPPVKLNKKRNTFASFKSFSLRGDKDTKHEDILEMSFKPKTVSIQNTIQRFEVDSNTTKNTSNDSTHVTKPQTSCIKKEKKSASNDTLDEIEKSVQKLLSDIGDKYEHIDETKKVRNDSDGWCALVTVSSSTNIPVSHINEAPLESDHIDEAKQIVDHDNRRVIKDLINESKETFIINQQQNINNHNVERGDQCEEDIEDKCEGLSQKLDSQKVESIEDDTEEANIIDNVDKVDQCTKNKNSGSSQTISSQKLAVIEDESKNSVENEESNIDHYKSNVDQHIEDKSDSSLQKIIDSDSYENNGNIVSIRDESEDIVVEEQSNKNYDDVKEDVRDKSVSTLDKQESSNVKDIGSDGMVDDKLKFEENEDESEESETDNTYSNSEEVVPHVFSKAVDSTNTSITEEISVQEIPVLASIDDVEIPDLDEDESKIPVALQSQEIGSDSIGKNDSCLHITDEDSYADESSSKEHRLPMNFLKAVENSSTESSDSDSIDLNVDELLDKVIDSSEVKVDVDTKSTPPERPQRRTSIRRNNSEQQSTPPPCVPMRKKRTNSSVDNAQLKNEDKPTKAKVRTYHTPKPQTVQLSNDTDGEKECCIQ